MREFFHRSFDGARIGIEVELDAHQYAQSYTTLFSVFIKFDLDSAPEDAKEDFLSLRDALILAIEYDAKAIFVGSRDNEGWHEIYFYTIDGKEFTPLVSSILVDSNYSYESNAVKDKSWSFYDNELYPSALEFAHMQSKRIIQMLKNEGDDLKVAREVEHYLSFETPTQKDKCIANFNVDGFMFKDEISSDDFDNGVAIATTHSMLQNDVDVAVEKIFETLAMYHAYYEGWSTTLVKKEESNV